MSRPFRILAPCSLLFLAAAFFLIGCTTKNYVRNQTAPLADRANTLDAEAARNRRDLSDVDTRATAGIANAQSSADAAGQHAGRAQTDAQNAQTAADAANRDVADLGGVVANLDNYHPVASEQVLFATGHSELSRTAKQQLDGLGDKLATTPHYLLEITGATDSTGSAELNYQLSQHRAQAVVAYLATKYNVPGRNFYLIGVGKDAEAATNKTAAGRAKNRRVSVRLLVRGPATGSAPTAG